MQLNTEGSTQPSFGSPSKDAFDILAERNFETLMTYDNSHYKSPMLNLVQLEIIQEEKKDSQQQQTAREEEPAKPRKAFKGAVNFSVNTAMCRSELELIQHVIDANGFGES